MLPQGCYLCMNEWLLFDFLNWFTLRVGIPVAKRTKWNIWERTEACRFVWINTVFVEGLLPSLFCILFFVFDRWCLSLVVAVCSHHCTFILEVCRFPVIAVPEWVTEAAGVRPFCKLQYTATYDLVSTCDTHVLTEITFNYGNILPDSKHSVVPVKIILFVVRWSKSGLKMKK